MWAARSMVALSSSARAVTRARRRRATCPQAGAQYLASFRFGTKLLPQPGQTRSLQASRRANQRALLYSERRHFTPQTKSRGPFRRPTWTNTGRSQCLHGSAGSHLACAKCRQTHLAQTEWTITPGRRGQLNVVVAR